MWPQLTELYEMNQAVKNYPVEKNVNCCTVHTIFYLIYLEDMKKPVRLAASQC